MERSIHIVPPTPITARREAIGCCHGGCRRPTHGGKPVCSEHVEGMPYVRDLLASLARRRRPA